MTNDDNIVYFPGLVDRLLDKGMDALDDKRHKEAQQYFADLLSHEPKHPQAHLGYLLSLFGSGQLSDAKEHCEKMLREDLGDYYETLQIYLSILVQLNEYDRAVEMIEVVLQENKLPPEMAESFYQILEFSRDRASGPKVHKEPEPEKPDLDWEQQRSLINSGEVEKQWVAIQNLSESNNNEAIQLYEQFLKNEENDPFLKSIILQILNKKNYHHPVELYKFGQYLRVDPGEIGDLLADEFFNRVKEKLSETLEHENPTLYEMALQIWEHFVTAMYPVELSPREENLWAAALYQVTHDLNGIDISTEHTSEVYHIQAERLLKAVDQMRKVEAGNVKGLQ